jgi:hypothetical protein
MSRKQDEFFINKLKTELNQIPERNQDKVAEGKARFLAQAKLIQRSPVSNEVPVRHNSWNLKRIKEYKMGTLVTILVVIGMVMGGVGGTVAAAADDLPGQALYQVKLISEGLKLDLTPDPAKKVELDLQFAMRRLDEINELKEAGIEPPYMSYARFENHLMRAISQAASLENDEAEKVLLRIREMLQLRVQLLEQETGTPVQDQLRTMLHERINWLDEGITDPVRFLNEARIGWEDAPNQGEITGPQNGGVTDENRPGNQGQPGETPVPGSGNPTQGPGEGSGTGPNYGPTDSSGGNGSGQNGSGPGK